MTELSASKHDSGQQATAPSGLVAATGSPAGWLAAGALIFITLAAYWPVFRAGYVFDDDTYLTANPLIPSPSGLRDIWLKPSASVQYYPLVFTTYWLEYRFWGSNPAGYHFVNVALHMAGAILLWHLLRRLCVPGAWLAAMLFAVHPVHVESVAWIVERKNVLSGVFSLAAILAYLRFAGIKTAGQAVPTDETSEAPPKTRDLWVTYALSIVCFLLALFSKTAVCTLPLVLVLLLWWKRGRIVRADVWPLLPFFLLAVVMGSLTAWFERHQVGAEGEEFDWSLVESWLIAGRALWFYAGKLIWPAQLAFIYPRWNLDAAGLWQHLFPLTALAVPIVLWLARRRIGRAPLVAVLSFMLALAPILGFFKVYGMRYTFVADHWQYHASMSLIALFAAVWWEGGRRFFLWRGSSPLGRRAVPVAANVAIVGCLVVLTRHQVRAYDNAESLWRDTLRKNPSAWMAHNNLGKYLMEYVRTPEAVGEAIRHYRETIRLSPRNYKAMANLGVAFALQKRLDDAIAQYRAAIAIEPRYGPAYQNLGAALAAKNQLDEAVEILRQAVALQPADPGGHRNLAVALEQRAQEGDMAEAIAHFRLAIQAGRSDPALQGHLAWLLATLPDDRLRNGAEAVRLAEAACATTRHQDPEPLLSLAAAYAEMGRFEKALPFCRRAHELAVARSDNTLIARVEACLQRLQAGRPVRLTPAEATQPA